MQAGGRQPTWALLLAAVGVSLLVGIVSGGLSGAVVASLTPGRDARLSAAKTPTADAPAPTTVLNVKEESALTDTVNKVLPGIVTLIVQSSRRDSAGRLIESTNLGSGVVIDPRGFIITNQHVIDGGSKITVKFSNGDEQPGVLVGDDSPFIDIALVRVQPNNLTPVAIGDSNSLILGQRVLAIGSIAFGANYSDFRNNVTQGVVSGLKRRWPRDDVVMEDLIQTDASVNRGNSGGALVTLNGELVGITTTVVRATEDGSQVQGVAFAIPSSTFKPIVDELMKGGKVLRPYIGIQHQQITAQVARQNNLPVTNGAVVLDVVSDSPAARAGLRRGDIILRLANTEITEEMPYLNVLIRQKPSTSVPVTYLRGGRETTVDLAIGQR